MSTKEIGVSGRVCEKHNEFYEKECRWCGSVNATNNTWRQLLHEAPDRKLAEPHMAGLRGVPGEAVTITLSVDFI